MKICINLCNQLQDIYHWQDNSEGPWIFASKILFLLRFVEEDVDWFKQQLESTAKDQKKKRATLIVATPNGILLTLAEDGICLLPGGAVKRGELPINAAVRELFEETGLKAKHIEFLFETQSQYYQQHVFLVHRYTGTPIAQSDALALDYLSEDALGRHYYPSEITESHQKILQRYVEDFSQIEKP